MNSFFVVLSVAGAALAQMSVNGASMVAYSSAAASSSGGSYYGNSAPPAATAYASSTAVASYAQYTSPPSSSYDIYSIMPYASMTAGGYSSLSCGYGYTKAYDGSCQAESWYTFSGCYETIIINNVEQCYTQTVTETMTQYNTVTETMTETMTDTNTITATEIMTSTELVPTTRIWVSTEVIDNTITNMYTLTATETETQINIYTQTATETDTETATSIEQETQTQFVTMTDLSTIIQPTTYVSVYVSTDIIDNTMTVENTLTATMTDFMTVISTSLATQIQTETQTDEMTVTQISTMVEPTTYTSVYISTDVINNTMTIENTMTSTLVDSVTYLQTMTATATELETETATATETQTVQDTQLASCLNSCMSSWSLTEGNSDMYNTYASTTSVAYYTTSSSSTYMASATASMLASGSFEGLIQERPSCIEEDKDVSKVLLVELSPIEMEIVSCDATALLNYIRERRFSCLQVIQAHCHVATIAQDLTNCLTEIFFEEALQRAEELDHHLDKTGKLYGPLHGLPVSVKDHIMVEGKDTSTGYIAWCYKSVAKEDAVAVDILRKAGAILFVKTNNPQTLLSLETDNNIFGKTLNPFNRDLTPGGSSGGESALIAFHGSPIGLGTDIGGSIRLPAACTGLYGFKASIGRIPHKGLLGSHDGMDAIVGVLGPIARSARDLSLFCKVMLQYEPWLAEASLLELPWKQNIVEGEGIPSKLCFAILWDDKVFRPDPPILNAMAKCKAMLTAAGHNVIDWMPIDHEEAWDLIVKLYFLDGGREYNAVLMESGEPPVPQTKWIMNQVANGGKPFSVAEIFQLNLQREAFRHKLLKHWNNTKIKTGTGRPVDAIIAPVAPTLAPRHNTTQWWGYTSYWNLADYPAAVFPIGHCANNEGQLWPTLNGNDGLRHRQITDQWDPALHEGLPVCLQLIGRRLNEEKVLGILNVVDKIVNKETLPKT
ncbi:hypothetical protein EW145_g2769 [Phellinidium pouzarii]|uniref:amidase n=1 Tax=Phellinidium pouzarii TaxID=167371 RepID=A0A4S4LA50_9AGAM|nr:hypothetical protein EW145_g2769 [Phellinidium pouzarii]